MSFMTINKNAAQAMFDQAAFVNDLGLRLGEVGEGWCTTSLAIAPRHLQQTGVVHAGVQATIADHTAGVAATTLLGSQERVLTIEFKINLLRGASGHTLRCRSTVLKPGRTVSIVESEVFAVSDSGEKLVAKAMVTLAVRPL
jgi:uncharacterized protein (TIGR00369 family)